MAFQKLNRLRRMAGLLILLLSLAVLAWGIWPSGELSRSMPLQPANLQLAGLLPSSLARELQAGSPGQPALLEDQSLVLEWPAVIRLGDTDQVRLIVGLAETGKRGTAVKTAVGLDSSPGLYQTYNIVAEARLEMGGVQVSPNGEISEILRPGQALNFSWKVRPLESGSNPGTVWLSLHFIPRNGAGEENRLPLTAQRIEVGSWDLFGLDGPAVRVVGTAGVVAGCILGLDGLLSRIRRRKT